MARMINSLHLSRAARRLMVLASILTPMTGAYADSPVHEPLVPLDGVWEVYDADGLHTAPVCIVILTKEKIRDRYAVKGNENCQIRAMAASTGWDLYGMGFYDSSGNETVKLPLHPDKDTYTSTNGEMVATRLSLARSMRVHARQMSTQLPAALAGAAATMLIIGARRRYKSRRATGT